MDTKSGAAAGVKDAEVIEQHQPVAEAQQLVTRVDETALAMMPDAISIQRKPREVIAMAIEAAQALMGAISKKAKVVKMNDEQYIEVEDWTLVAAFHGCTLQLESDEYVEYGGAQGWEATVALIARDGRVVGRATMMCMNDEEKWRARAKYEWLQLLKGEKTIEEQYGFMQDEDDRSDTRGRWFAKKGEAPSSALVWEDTDQDNPSRPGEKKRRPVAKRILIGEEQVPQFQLRSMAQTRASGKVCRMNLAYIVMLAGLKTTPAEELLDTGQAQHVDNTKQQKAAGTTNGNGTASQSQQTTKTSQAGSGAPFVGYPATGGDETRKITDVENGAFWNYVLTQNASQQAVAKWVRETFNIASGKDMTVEQLRKAVRYVLGDIDGSKAAAERQVGEEG